MATLYTRLMDRLYLLCILVGVISVVTMTGLIFAGVVMRYLFDMGARWAEPSAIFFTVQLTMYGAAACYRAHVHLRLLVFVHMLRPALRRAAEILVQLLMAAVAVLMVVYGTSLARTTWFQAYPEFDYIKVGLVYSAIPGSGVVLLLFVVEALLIRPAGPEPEPELEEALEHAAAAERRLAAGGDERRPA